MINPQCQSLQADDDSNDEAQVAPATESQLPRHYHLAQKSVPLSALDRQQLLASVLRMPGGSQAEVTARSSPSSSRPNSPQETGQNPPALAKAIASWSVNQRNGKEAMPPRITIPGPILPRVGPTGMALSFVKKRAEEKKTAVAVSDNLVQGLRRDMRDEL